MARGEIAALERGEDLSEQQAGELMMFLVGGQATDLEIGSILTALHAKGETAAEVTGMAKAARSMAVALEVGGGLLDTCGTGGDNLATFNISTLAALVASACGAKVVKHGGRAASGMCGSADVLEALGVAIALGPAGVKACLEEVGIGFCFAPSFHPAFKHVGPTRKRLKSRTVFNFLGPLLNPAHASYQSLGVSDPKTGSLMMSVLEQMGVERALVYCSGEGMDELSLSSSTHVIELREGRTWEYEIEPSQVGLVGAPLDAVRGGNAEVNAKIAHQVLAGMGGARRDVVVLNAAGALRAAGLASDWRTGLNMAREALDSGRAEDLLTRWARASQKAASPMST
jgi:anthranilate phosphoribosyltransferase